MAFSETEGLNSKHNFSLISSIEAFKRTPFLSRIIIGSIRFSRSLT